MKKKVKHRFQAGESYTVIHENTGTSEMKKGDTVTLKYQTELQDPDDPEWRCTNGYFVRESWLEPIPKQASTEAPKDA